MTDANRDAGADATIRACLSLNQPHSFFLFAGAGSGKTRALKNALEGLDAQTLTTLRQHSRKIAVITYKADRQPRCVTFGSVEKRLGIRQERLVAMLSNTDGSSHLTLQQVEELKARIGDIIPIQRAGSVAGCSYHNVTELIKAGLLLKRSNGASTASLSRAQIHALIQPVQSLPEGRPTSKLMAIEEVRQLTTRRIVLIYQHFLDGKLPSARRDSAKHGINSLLLDLDETRKALRGVSEHHGLRIVGMLRHHLERRLVRRRCRQDRPHPAP